MKAGKAIRKSFYKPYHFLNKRGGDSLRCLYEISKSFHLDDFKRELQLWQELALCNDQSAYDEGGRGNTCWILYNNYRSLLRPFM